VQIRSSLAPGQLTSTDSLTSVPNKNGYAFGEVAVLERVLNLLTTLFSGEVVLCRLGQWWPAAALSQVRGRPYPEPHSYRGGVAYEAANEADAVVVGTEWAAFRHLNLLQVRAMMRTPVLIDGLNLYDSAEMSRLGFHYRSISHPNGRHRNGHDEESCCGRIGVAERDTCERHTAGVRPLVSGMRVEPPRAIPAGLGHRPSATWLLGSPGPARRRRPARLQAGRCALQFASIL
jgi:hypothetical protein